VEKHCFSRKKTLLSLPENIAFSGAKHCPVPGGGRPLSDELDELLIINEIIEFQEH